MKLTTAVEVDITDSKYYTDWPKGAFAAILNLVKNIRFPKDPRFFDFDKNPLAHIIYGPLSSVGLKD